MTIPKEYWLGYGAIILFMYGVGLSAQTIALLISMPILCLYGILHLIMAIDLLRILRHKLWLKRWKNSHSK